ncbi:hypothetical protein RJ55_03412 [Drechmeria coniospora]|nr:hypothetical protein RJ55_03412 [Drechmeria coniospora]
MSYAVEKLAAGLSSSSGASGISSTKATVLDFNCLFTHDLRRKQKRWQDGRLKYHTFNKRVMVYDERGNFIGDAHWQGACAVVEEGEELALDRGSAIVQVAECVGEREQDLSEVLDRRVREVEKRRAEAAAKTPAARVATRRQEGTGQPHLHHQRPLTSIAASPGPLGRAAVSDRSPYEVRLAAATDDPDGNPKRRRLDVSPPSKAGYAQNLFGTQLTLSSCPVPLGGRSTATKTRPRPPREQLWVPPRDAGRIVAKENDEDDDNDDLTRRNVLVTRGCSKWRLRQREWQEAPLEYARSNLEPNRIHQEQTMGIRHDDGRL